MSEGAPWAPGLTPYMQHLLWKANSQVGCYPHFKAGILKLSKGKQLPWPCHQVTWQKLGKFWNLFYFAWLLIVLSSAVLSRMEGPQPGFFLECDMRGHLTNAVWLSGLSCWTIFSSDTQKSVILGNEAWWQNEIKSEVEIPSAEIHLNRIWETIRVNVPLVK